LPASAFGGAQRSHGRAGIKGVIKELRSGFGLPGLCCQKFFATEAAHFLAFFTYNLVNLFCRHLGWLDRLHISTCVIGS
jgi:hypothetical protein